MSIRVPAEREGPAARGDANEHRGTGDTRRRRELRVIALGLIGDEWNLTIVRLAILEGVRRYKDFRDRLGIANSVLTVRLRHLTEVGVFDRAQYSEAPRRFEYVLTRRGRDLWKVLLTVWAWEAEWVPEHSETLPSAYHTECGSSFSPVMRCRICGDAARPARRARRHRAERRLQALHPARPHPAVAWPPARPVPAWCRRRSS